MKLIINNKKAGFDYNLLKKEKFLAGIELLGIEVKLIKQKKVSIKNSYCKLINNNIYIFDMYISNSNIYNTKFSPKRRRKLLLKKKEINKIKKQIKNLNLNIIPTEIVLNNRNFIKIKFFLAKSKKKYEKRNLIKIKSLEKANFKKLYIKY
ncbi:MAG: SsrA-binding protein [Candidatus Karelsulcia muelleri]|uniref:SsrA-binding protein n=1 Tax=Candidatus Karelsulcia muelleri TaxID=336810 RepID=UPI000D7B9743|nr:SsrA-binding protein [Candidatus Karelsulcia muelleri]